jgi:hypothetical protein
VNKSNAGRRPGFSRKGGEAVYARAGAFSPSAMSISIRCGSSSSNSFAIRSTSAGLFLFSSRQRARPPIQRRRAQRSGIYATEEDRGGHESDGGFSTISRGHSKTFRRVTCRGWPLETKETLKKGRRAQTAHLKKRRAGSKARLFFFIARVSLSASQAAQASRRVYERYRPGRPRS